MQERYYDPSYFHLHSDALPVLGDQSLREVLKETVFMVPKSKLDDVLGNCVFLMINKNGPPGFFIHWSLIKCKAILVFHDGLYQEELDEQRNIVLHEIAHYILDHIDKDLSKEDYEKQEKAAKAQADKWIADWMDYDKMLRSEAIKP